jgi:hypothetical protein
MQRVPYWEMEPDNGIVATREALLEGVRYRTGFCASKKGEVYLVFCCYGQTASVNLPAKTAFDVTLINPRSGEETSLGQADGGSYRLKMPAGEWLVLLRRRP